MTHNKLILYIGGSCPYCAKVIAYLQHSTLEVEIKDVWANDIANQEMLALTDRTQVPCLRIGDSIMHESLDIIEKLKELSLCTFT